MYRKTRDTVLHIYSLNVKFHSDFNAFIIFFSISREKHIITVAPLRLYVDYSVYNNIIYKYLIYIQVHTGAVCRSKRIPLGRNLST